MSKRCVAAPSLKCCGTASAATYATRWIRWSQPWRTSRVSIAGDVPPRGAALQRACNVRGLRAGLSAADAARVGRVC